MAMRAHPDVAVLVASVRALNMHGGVPHHAAETNLNALEVGLANLDKHIENLTKFGLPVVVALNQFPTDTPEELELVMDYCHVGMCGWPAPKWVAKGGAGGIELPRPYWMP